MADDVIFSPSKSAPQTEYLTPSKVLAPVIL